MHATLQEDMLSSICSGHWTLFLPKSKSGSLVAVLAVDCDSSQASAGNKHAIWSIPVIELVGDLHFFRRDL